MRICWELPWQSAWRARGRVSGHSPPCRTGLGPGAGGTPCPGPAAGSARWAWPGSRAACTRPGCRPARPTAWPRSSPLCLCQPVEAPQHSASVCVCATVESFGNSVAPPTFFGRRYMMAERCCSSRMVPNRKCRRASVPLSRMAEAKCTAASSRGCRGDWPSSHCSTPPVDIKRYCLQVLLQEQDSCSLCLVI